jgi:uncharacterized membrane protein
MPNISGQKILQFLDRRAVVLLGALSIVTSLVLIAVGVWKYNHFQYDALDLGIYSQVIWNTSQGRWFEMSIHPQSYLGDHLEIYLLPISLLYKIWSDPRLLIVLQILIINAAVWPFFILARNIFREQKQIIYPAALALLIVWVYLLNPFVNNAALFEWHVISLFILPFGLALMYAERGRYWPTMLCLVATLIIREDAANIVALAGLTTWLVFPKARQQNFWKWTLPPLLVSILWFIAATYIVSLYSPTHDYKFIGFSSNLTGNYWQTASWLLTHPTSIFKNLLSWAHPQTILALFVPTVFLPFISYQSLLLALTPFLEFALINSNTKQLLVAHYSILFVPANTLGAILTLRLLSQKLNQAPILKFVNLPNQILWHLVLLFLIASPVYALARSSELARINWHYDQGQASKFTENALRQALSEVKNEDGLVVTKRLLPILANRPHVYPEIYVRRGQQQLTTAPYEIRGPVNALIIDQLVTNSVGNWQQGELKYIPPHVSSQNLAKLVTTNNLRPSWQKDGVAIFRPSTNQLPIVLTEELGETRVDRPFNDQVNLGTEITKINDQEIDLKIFLTLSRPYPSLAYIELFFLDASNHKVGKHILAPAWGLISPADWPLHETVATYYRLTVPANSTSVKISLQARDETGALTASSNSYRITPLPSR